MNNFKLKESSYYNWIKRNLKIILLVSLIIIAILFYHFILQPRQIIYSTYVSPDNYPFIDINKQVIKSTPQSDFIKGLNVKTLNISPTQIVMLATYSAPNYLDADNALMADIFKLHASLFTWNVDEIRTTYVSINNGDINQAQKEIEAAINAGNNGLNQQDVDALVKQNTNLLSQYQGLTNNNNTTNDNKMSFNIVSTDNGSKIQITGSSKSPSSLSPIYANWSDNNTDLFYVDKVINGGYEVVKFNAITGQQDVIYKTNINQGLLGFIQKGNYVGITSRTYIGILKLSDLTFKKVLTFPAVGLNNDQIYIPDIQPYDANNFQAEILDQDYLNNHKVVLWKVSWDGSAVSKISEYTK